MDIDIERLKFDREYWDAVAPEWAGYLAHKIGALAFVEKVSGVMDDGLRFIPRPAKPEKGQEPGRIAPVWDGEPDAYMCPARCGCLWRDNGDDTMSLYGPNSQSCDVCEPLPMDRLIPVKDLRTKEQRQRDELDKLVRTAYVDGAKGHVGGLCGVVDAILARYNLEPKP